MTAWLLVLHLVTGEIRVLANHPITLDCEWARSVVVEEMPPISIECGWVDIV
jgi:hypothetical protein